MKKVFDTKLGTPGNRRLLKAAAFVLVPGVLLGWTQAEFAPASVETGKSSEEMVLETNRADVLVLGAGSRLWVDGNSTVRSYSCETEQLEGRVEIDESAPTNRVAELSERVTRMTVSVPVGTLECGNDTMNRHMLDALKASDHGTIRFTMERSEVVADGESGTAMLGGILRIAGQDQPVVLFGQVVDTPDGKIMVTGSYELDMTDFGVSPPRLMLGTMRVHDDVVVNYELVLQP